MNARSNGCLGITRRGFLLGAGIGLAAGAPMTWHGLEHWRRARKLHAKPVEVARPEYAMPGRFPGRVVEIHDPRSVSDDNLIQRESVQRMLGRGMCELTGADHPTEGWKRFFEKGDVVGVKVNPVGRKRKRGEVGSISSPEVLVEIVKNLNEAGIPAKDIIVFERYADEFRDAGYEAVLRELPGVRWHASATGYSEQQVDIEGYDGKRDRDPHVVGYDRDAFVHMGFASPDHDPKDDRRFRSHLSLIVSQLVNKFITIPVLKDHRSAGVTLALKNISHGMNNNVARSHIAPVKRGDLVNGPNQCNTFIPTAVSQPLIRQKATLHIMDGLIGVYEGGPGSWNRTWATWRHKSLFFATDPVAMDMVGWDIIDEQRLKAGWPTVGRMGLMNSTPAVRAGAALGGLASDQPLGALTLTAAGGNIEGGRGSEVFERRQPEHVILGGTIGLGVYDRRGIDHRRVTV